MYSTRVTLVQREYLVTVARLWLQLGYAPTVQEIATERGRARHAVEMALGRLQRDGLVDRDYATARSIRLTEAGRAALAGEAA